MAFPTSWFGTGDVRHAARHSRCRRRAVSAELPSLRANAPYD
jgi:hypothetical protein